MLATIYQLEAYRPEPERELPPAPETLLDIAQEVCARRRVGLADLKGRCAQRYIAWPRQEFFALAYATGRYSYPQIARWCGNRHHTSVLTGIRQHLRRANGWPPLEAWA